jgi:pimeloyl-ACP methyl ester carboxylesterase
MHALLLLLALAADPLPSGSSRIELDLAGHARAAGKPLEVFVHKPASHRGERMLIVFHGVNRNADEYRDHAIGMGERYGMLVVAPRFDAERFPNEAYHRGGILQADGAAADPADWTWALVPGIAKALRAREGRPDMPYWLIGHSAGGQFCMRMAAFQATGAERIVAANPGSALFPTREMRFGYGFGGLPESLSDDARIRSYLAAPLTLYLGTADDREDEWLDTSAPAMLQGPGRLQRNRAAFAAAEALAKEKGWAFAWRKVEAEGVGHDHEKLFEHAAVEQALFGPRPAAQAPDPAPQAPSPAPRAPALAPR